MAADDETKPVKRGRGRPPKPDSEKKAAVKRKAEPAVDADGNPVVKKGRGRPAGTKNKPKAPNAAKPIKKAGKGRGRPKKNAEAEASAEEETENGADKEGESEEGSE